MMDKHIRITAPQRSWRVFSRENLIPLHHVLSNAHFSFRSRGPMWSCFHLVAPDRWHSSCGTLHNTTKLHAGRPQIAILGCIFLLVMGGLLCWIQLMIFWCITVYSLLITTDMTPQVTELHGLCVGWHNPRISLWTLVVSDKMRPWWKSMAH